MLLTGLMLQIQVQSLRTAGWLHWESPWTVGQLPATGLGASAFTIVDNWEGGYLNDGYAVDDARWLLQNYQTALRSFHEHPISKPPGGILLMHAMISAVEALPHSFLEFSFSALTNVSGLKTAVEVLQSESEISSNKLTPEQQTVRRLAYPLVIVLVAALLTLASTLAAVPLFFLAKELLGNAEAAVAVVMLWLCLPGPLLLAPTWDQLYPILFTTILLLAMRSRWLPFHLGRIFVGLLLALCLMLTPLFVIIIPVCAVLTIWPRVFSLAGQWRIVVADGAVVLLEIVATVAAAFYLLKLFTGFDYTASTIYATAGAGFQLKHPVDQWHLMWSRDFRWNRPYYGEVIFNQYEFALALGLIPFTCAVAQAFGAMRRVLGQWRNIARIDLFVLGTTGALLFVSVSGRLNFEAARLGLPLFPAVLIATICYLQTAVPDSRRHIILPALGIVQIIWVMVVREFMVIS
jgi:hypothetical protein